MKKRQRIGEGREVVMVIKTGNEEKRQGPAYTPWEGKERRRACGKHEQH